MSGSYLSLLLLKHAYIMYAIGYIRLSTWPFKLFLYSGGEATFSQYEVIMHFYRRLISFIVCRLLFEHAVELWKLYCMRIVCVGSHSSLGSWYSPVSREERKRYE